MSEKKHIDRLFQEKFKDFEVSPDNSVWKNIEKELKSNKRKKFIIPFWYKIAGAAAILALVFLAGNFILKPSDKAQVVGSETEEKSDSNNILEKDLKSGPAIVLDENSAKNIQGEKIQENNIFVEPREKESNSSENVNSEAIAASPEKLNERNSYSLTTNSEKEIVPKEKMLHPKENFKVGKVRKSIAENKFDSEKTTRIEKNDNNSSKIILTPETKISAVASVIKNNKEITKTEGVASEINSVNTETEKQKSLLEVAAAQKEEKPLENQIEPELAQNATWQINPYAGPIYYNGFGSQNAIDPSLAENESESETTMSYGINFSYKISDRLKIRSGIGQVSMAYNTHDIAFATAVKPTSFSNVSYDGAASELEIIPLNSGGNDQNGELLGRSPYTEGTLHQQIGFIEVPLELEYALIDKKFGVSVIGGASTLFLNDNSLVINSENGRTNVGEMKNLNDVSFSTNIGLGLDYKISTQFEINLEPTFKYQINSFSGNDNGFKPYYFGIYTGIGFKF